MKKIFSIIVAAVIAVSAQAQIYSSRSVNTESANYNRIYASYSSYSLSPKEGDGQSASGFRFGWLKGISVMSEQPLFIEVGVNGQYNAKSEEESEDIEGYKVSASSKTSFLKFTVPVNVAYKYALTKDVKVIPHTGIHVGANIIGESEVELNVLGKKESTKVSYFDEDKVGKDNTASRVQVGWQIGVGFELKKLYLGFEYSLDFNKYMEGVSSHDIYATLGINF